VRPEWSTGMTGMGEHRVPLLGTAWRRNDDPATSRDPQVRAVVGALATLPAPELNAEFRAELRAQLVAITPRIVAESAQTGRMVDIVPAAPARPRPMPHGRPAARPVPAPRGGARHADGVLARLRGSNFARPLTVAASVIVAFALLLGGAVVMSRKALPGDALYGLKRASERFELATAGSAVDKAKDYLEFATNRANEAKSLSGHAGNADTAQLIGGTLNSADSDVRAAARLLGTNAVQHHSSKPLAAMRSWAPGQEQRLAALVAALSDPTLRAQAQSSLRLVRAAEARAVALAGKMGCGCLTTANADALGPKPCTNCNAPAVIPHKTTAPAGRHSGTKTHPHKNGQGTASGRSHHVGPVVGPTPSSNPTPTQPNPSQSHPISLPSLPTGSVSLPVSASSCGVTVKLPIIGGVNVGLCSGVNVNVGG